MAVEDCGLLRVFVASCEISGFSILVSHEGTKTRRRRETSDGSDFGFLRIWQAVASLGSDLLWLNGLVVCGLMVWNFFGGSEGRAVRAGSEACATWRFVD